MGKSISERFEEMTKLYHFTSFDAACSIIESRKFRFGKMFKMNDLIESGRIHFRRIFTNDLPDKDLFAEDEMRRYQVVQRLICSCFLLSLYGLEVALRSCFPLTVDLERKMLQAGGRVAISRPSPCQGDGLFVPKGDALRA